MDLVVSEKVGRRILKSAKLESESCLSNIVYCLSVGAFQSAGPMDANMAAALGQAAGKCECWETVREILELLFPDQEWSDWRLVFAIAEQDFRKLPVGKSDRYYRKRVKELCRTAEDLKRCWRTNRSK